LFFTRPRTAWCAGELVLGPAVPVSVPAKCTAAAADHVGRMSSSLSSPARVLPFVWLASLRERSG
jgi:hypothetical protein